MSCQRLSQINDENSRIGRVIYDRIKNNLSTRVSDTTSGRGRCGSGKVDILDF